MTTKTTTPGMDDKGSIRLRFSPTEGERELLSRVKTYLREDSKVRAMGQPVTDQVALRYALTLGLEEVERVVSQPSQVVSMPSPEVPRLLAEWSRALEAASAGETVAVVAPDGVIRAPEPQGVPAPAPEPEPAPAPAPQPFVPELYERQPHWEYFDQGEWEIPDDQEALHRYYADAGWIRCAAAAEGVTVQLYWTPVSAQQGLPVWPGQDAEGRRLTVQTVPEVGTAHVIPQGFGGERDELEGAVVWSPG